MTVPHITGLPAELGFTDLRTDHGLATASMTITSSHLAPIGRLHAAAVITLADTACGYGCLASLPDGVAGFATSTITSHHLATANVGETITVEARLVHAGRTTQLWDATVARRGDARPIATIRCLQQLLDPPSKDEP